MCCSRTLSCQSSPAGRHFHSSRSGQARRLGSCMAFRGTCCSPCVQPEIPQLKNCQFGAKQIKKQLLRIYCALLCSACHPRPPWKVVLMALKHFFEPCAVLNQPLLKRLAVFQGHGLLLAKRLPLPRRRNATHIIGALLATLDHVALIIALTSGTRSSHHSRPHSFGPPKCLTTT